MASRSGRSRSGAYLPLYVGDYLRDTQHLNEAEDGVYHRLLMTYWATGEPLPSDDRKLAAIARVPIDRWMATYKPTMLEFFRPNSETWHQKRMDEELRIWRENSKKNQEAGRASGRARAQRSFNDHSTNDEPPNPVPNPVLNPTPTPTSKKSRARPLRGTRLPPGWFPGPEGTAFCREVRPDLNPDDVFEEFRDYWVAQPGQRGVKVDWQATWRNWVRKEKVRA